MDSVLIFFSRFKLRLNELPKMSCMSLIIGLRELECENP